MNTPNRSILESFALTSIPDLDTCVLGALELFVEKGVPVLPNFSEGKVLIVGSGNAAVTARILAQLMKHAVPADESEYETALNSGEAFTQAVIISASGGKHAVSVAKKLKEVGVPTLLITHNPEPRAGVHIAKDAIVVLPKNREPYTYNTSTYLGVLLSVTKENPQTLFEYLEKNITSQKFDFAKYNACYITVPVRFRYAAPLFLTKFDELFGSRINGRAYTEELAKHATTVVPNDTECFITFSESADSVHIVENRITIPVPTNAGYGFMLAVGYYLIGQIQKQHPPYYKDNIVSYCERASKLFGETISPIVE